MRTVEEEEETGMRVGTEEKEAGETEERKWSVLRVERQKREVERGRGRGGGGVVEKEKREVESGRGGRGERVYTGERGTSIMGCRMSTEVWQVAGWNVLKEWKKERQGQSVGHRMDIGKSGPMRKRNIDVSQTMSDSEIEKQLFWMSEHKAKNGGRK